MWKTFRFVCKKRPATKVLKRIYLFNCLNIKEREREREGERNTNEFQYKLMGERIGIWIGWRVTYHRAGDLESGTPNGQSADILAFSFNEGICKKKRRQTNMFSTNYFIMFLCTLICKVNKHFFILFLCFNRWLIIYFTSHKFIERTLYCLRL